MQSEKMMILKMLEEGKINADEASRLLASASGDTPPPRHDPQRPPSTTTHSAPKKPASHDSRSNEQAGTSGMGQKITEFITEMEPKVKKFASQVAGKTIEAADAISKSFQSDPESLPSHYSSSITKPSSAGVEEVAEIKVSHTDGELNLATLNGHVTVKGYNGDKISAKIYTVAKRPGAAISLAVLGNKYYLSYEEDDFERVSIDAFVPEGMFNTVKVASSNGNLNLSSITADHVFLEGYNGSSDISDIKAKNLTIETNNGALTLKDTTAQHANIENFNGNIFIGKTDICNLDVSTFNGAIEMQIADFLAYDDYSWNVETSNGKLLAVLPTYSTLGYHLKAHAALSTAKLGLVGMDYLNHSASSFEAVSVNYEMCLKKVKIELTTSNAPLTVN